MSGISRLYAQAGSFSGLNGMHLARLSAIAALLATALAARPAAACVPPPCWPAASIPAGPATVPANVPALGFTLMQMGGTPIGDPTGFQLLDPDGKAVGLTFEQTMFQPGTYLVRPKEALQPNRAYKIRYPQGCPGYQPKTPPDIVERVLTTGPATPLPTTIGTAVVTGHRVATAQVGQFLGSCVLSPLRAGLTHVEIRPSPEFQSYLALGRVGAQINGRSAPVVNYQQPGPNAPIEMDLYAHCAGDAGVSSGLMPGKYQVQFDAQLFGVTPLPPPISVMVDLHCDERPAADAGGAADARSGGEVGMAAETGTPADAGVPPADAGGSPADAGMPTTDAGPTLAADSSGCGCALGARSTSGTAALMLVVIALALLRPQSRRR